MGRTRERRFNTAPHAADLLLLDYPVMIRLLARDATPGLVGKTQYTRLRGAGGVAALESTGQSNKKNTGE